MNVVNITPIILGILCLCSLICTIVIIPALRAKVKSENFKASVTEIDTLIGYARIVCSAMEEMFPGESEKKRTEAMAKIKIWCEGNGFTFDEIEIRGALEKVVAEINAEVHQ